MDCIYCQVIIIQTTFIVVLWRRRHNRELISKTTHLAQCSFIVRMLYKDMY